MSIVELFVIAVGLSMDAFAVSVCKGLSTQRLRAQHCVICGLYFGGFQGLMPLVGWLLGVRFQNAITSMAPGWKESSRCSASPRDSRSMLTPMAVSSTKAIQWSTLVMAF